METIRKWLHHVLNPLHIYCRMRGMGVEECTAKCLGEKYEKYIYKAFLNKIIDLTLGDKLKSWFTRRRHGKIKKIFEKQPPN